jgi:integrase/recombinase XerD
MDELLQKLNENLLLLGYSPRTQETYSHRVRKLYEYFNKPPQYITNEELREYFLYLYKCKKYSYSTITLALFGIKFLYEKTLNKNFDIFNIVRPKKIYKLPVVLSRDEVKDILKNINVLRHRACLTLIYSCGLRLNEGVGLKVNQVDSKRMLIHIRQAKGNKDRYVPLPLATLHILRAHYKTHKNPVYIFPAPGRNQTKESTSLKPLPDTSIQTAFRKSLLVSGINKDAHIHTLRHSYATHLYEDGIDIRIIQEYLGHQSIKSTMIYTHLTPLLRHGVYDKINSIMDDLF